MASLLKIRWWSTKRSLFSTLLLTCAASEWLDCACCILGSIKGVKRLMSDEYTHHGCHSCFKSTACKALSVSSIPVMGNYCKRQRNAIMRVKYSVEKEYLNHKMKGMFEHKVIQLGKFFLKDKWFFKLGFVLIRIESYILQIWHKISD